MRKLSETLRNRGPDDAGVCLSDRAALAFSRLAVVDPDGGRQPMSGTHQGRSAVIAYTGEVFNYRELRRELRRLDHTFHDESDTEVVLRAYLEWGPDCARRFIGMFAFAVWDERRGTLLLIRDRFGIYPLHFHRVGETVAFGSEPKSVLAATDSRPVVDAYGLACILGFLREPGRTPFRDVQEVRPGEIIRFSRGQTVSSYYWTLSEAFEGDRRADFFELLEESVRSQLHADVPICVLLSGGLDSSTIAAFAARVFEQKGVPLRTFSMDFSYNTERFRGSEMNDSPDHEFSTLVSQWTKSEHAAVSMTTESLLDPGVRDRVIDYADMPVVAMDMYVAALRLSQLARGTSSVALTGDGADEILGGYVWFHDRKYLGHEGFPWLAASHGLELLAGLIDPGLKETLEIEELGRELYREAVAEAPLGPARDDREVEMRRITYLNITRYLRVVLDRKDRMGMGVALEGRVPFLDHRLVEKIYAMPWERKAKGGQSKAVLRDAMRGLLPDAVLRRIKNPFPTIQDPAYRLGLVRQLEDAVADRNSPVTPMLCQKTLKSLLSDSTLGLRSGVTRNSIDMALQLYSWCRQRNIEFRL